MIVQYLLVQSMYSSVNFWQNFIWLCDMNVNNHNNNNICYTFQISIVVNVFLYNQSVPIIYMYCVHVMHTNANCFVIYPWKQIHTNRQTMFQLLFKHYHSAIIEFLRWIIFFSGNFLFKIFCNRVNSQLCSLWILPHSRFMSHMILPRKPREFL